ncbi:hypothetical protein F5Y12DRAFT_603899 [Xylaria sp. FL1777]|nr:hypothetical protein F5Y12DRAFT_603899 [Xylaria sp. FL1777]
MSSLSSVSSSRLRSVSFIVIIIRLIRSYCRFLLYIDFYFKYLVNFLLLHHQISTRLDSERIYAFQHPKTPGAPLFHTRTTHTKGQKHSSFQGSSCLSFPNIPCL